MDKIENIEQGLQMIVEELKLMNDIQLSKSGVNRKMFYEGNQL